MLVPNHYQETSQGSEPPHRPRFNYSAYGLRGTHNQRVTLLGFNGELADSVAVYYLLGNGYRAFNPNLMRFNSPDSWSPFGDGGLNAYAYCGGDPINNTDPTGHRKFWKKIRNAVGFQKKRAVISSANPAYGTTGPRPAPQSPPSARATPTSDISDPEHLYMSISSNLHHPSNIVGIRNGTDRLIRVIDFPLYQIVSRMDGSGTITTRHENKESNVELQGRIRGGQPQ